LQKLNFRRPTGYSASADVIVALENTQPQ